MLLFIRTLIIYHITQFTVLFTPFLAFPYPEPVYTGCSSVHLNATEMPLVDPVYTGIPPGDPVNTCRVHWNTTGKVSWNSDYCSPHWNTTGGTVTAHTHPCRNINARLKWQGGGTPSRKWTGLCKFCFYLEFTALQWIPVLLLKTCDFINTALCMRWMWTPF